MEHIAKLAYAEVELSEEDAAAIATEGFAVPVVPSKRMDEYREVLRVGPRKDGVPSPAEMHDILKRRSIEIQLRGDD